MTREEIVEVLATALLNWTEPNGLPRLWGSEHSEHQARTALAALEAMGMVVVPVEPPSDMVDAGLECDHWAPISIYRAMIAARPK